MFPLEQLKDAEISSNYFNIFILFCMSKGWLLLMHFIPLTVKIGTKLVMSVLLLQKKSTTLKEDKIFPL